MECELGIPVSQYGLYQVDTDSGTMSVEITARTHTETTPDTKAPCAIRTAIISHLKAKKISPNIPDNFFLQILCKRCGDIVSFSAE